MRLAVVGKGGAGKSVVAGTMARILAREGERVLALDSDLLPGLSLSLGLGIDPEVAAPLDEAAEKDENGRWRLKPGIGPARAVARYATEAPDGIRLLQAGKTPTEGIAPIMGSLNAYFRVIHRLDEVKSFESWTMLGDLPAGPRHIAFNWAPYARTFVVVVQPTAQSALAGRRVARIARMADGVKAVYVANRVTGRADVTHVERLVGERVLAALPADEGVAEAEHLGRAPIDHAPDSPAVAEVERLVNILADL
jgi:CO dehydrogenase maturation factor